MNIAHSARIISSSLLVAALLFFAGHAAALAGYTNVNGVKVHSPVISQGVPKGATAKCKDGTYSYSQHRRGTCSGHKGVASWLASVR